MRKHVNSITARGLLPGSAFGNARLSARPWAPHHRHGAGCCQRLAFDHVGVDVAGQHDDERGPGFSSPDQPDGCLSLKLDDGRLCKLVLVPQRVRLGGGRPGRGERRRLHFAVSPQTGFGGCMWRWQRSWTVKPTRLSSRPMRMSVASGTVWVVQWVEMSLASWSRPRSL